MDTGSRHEQLGKFPMVTETTWLPLQDILFEALALSTKQQKMLASVKMTTWHCFAPIDATMIAGPFGSTKGPLETQATP